MNITIDTSALIAVIGNESTKPQIIEATKGCSLLAPPSVHWEIGNAFSAMFKRRSIDIELAKQSLATYHEIPIKFIDVSLDKALELSQALGIYAYDAYLLQCAQQTDTPLLSLDNTLINLAQNIGIETLEITR